MLIIRPEQMELIQAGKVEELIDWIETHLHTHFPERSEGMGPEKLRLFIEESYECCEELGVTSSASICKFVDMRLALGENFYQSSDYPWAARILFDESIPDVNDRVEQMSQIAGRL